MPIVRQIPVQQTPVTVDDQYYNRQMFEIMNLDDDFDPSLLQLNGRCYAELAPAVDDVSADYFLDEDLDCQSLGVLTAAFGGDGSIISQFDGSLLRRNEDPLLSDEHLTTCNAGQHQMENEKKFLPLTAYQDGMARFVKEQRDNCNTDGNFSTTHLPSIQYFITGQTYNKQSPSVSGPNEVTFSSTNGSQQCFDLVTQSLNAVDQSSAMSLDCYWNDLESVIAQSSQSDGVTTATADVLYSTSTRQFDLLENSSQLIADITWVSSEPLSPSIDSDSDSAISVTSGIGELADYISRQPTSQNASGYDWDQSTVLCDVIRRFPAKTKKSRINSDRSSVSLSPTSSPDTSGEDSGWPPSPQQMPRRRREKSRTPHLWKFMRTLLEDPNHNPEYIKWENKSEGVFRIVPGKSKHIASLWGLKKNNPSMTFDKLSRSLRWCRKFGSLTDLPKSDRYPKKLCFRFAKGALNWIPDQSVTIPSMDTKDAA